MNDDNFQQPVKNFVKLPLNSSPFSTSPSPHFMVSWFFNLIKKMNMDKIAKRKERLRETEISYDGKERKQKPACDNHGKSVY